MPFKGGTPTVVMKSHEQTKYEKMWEFKEYRDFAPGEGLASEFVAHMRPQPGSEVIDFGSGTGRGALMIAILSQAKVTMLDFAENSLDPEIKKAVETQENLSFQYQDLTKPIDISAPYGFCTDVMEHIPEKDVDKVLDNILTAAEKVFFQISTEDDHCGMLIEETLHNTVKPFSWWMKKFEDKDCLILFAEENDGVCKFVVNGWAKVTEFYNDGEVNTSRDEIVEHLKINSKRESVTQVIPHVLNDSECMILGGGPSLNDFEDEIIQKRKDGMALICVNGTYNWAIERGLKPSACVIVDARDFNKRFTQPVVDTCKYMLASQVHPDVFDAVPAGQTYIWHSVGNIGLYADTLHEVYGEEFWMPIPGGTTALLRAITLFRILGWAKFHIYGLDSCVRDGNHHAYEQPENNNVLSYDVSCGTKTFKCESWMITQAQEFLETTKLYGDDLSLIVYGDGLIAHMIKEAASLAA